MKKILFVLFFISFLLPVTELNGQIKINGQFDLGGNNLSNGLFLQFSNTGNYDKQFWGATAGYQLGLVQPQDVFFNSMYLGAHGKIPLGKINIQVGGEYLWTAFSEDLREVNWIVLAHTTLKHWQFGLGNNSRIYRFSNSASNENQTVDTGSRITEGWNFMYNVCYVLKPVESIWNFSAVITNYDMFLIEQETNPMVNVRFDYKLSDPLSLYSELWYKSSGLLNDQVNYFETFIRIGIQWKPRIKE